MLTCQPSFTAHVLLVGSNLWRRQNVIVNCLFGVCAQLQISGLFLRQRVTLHLVVQRMALSAMELGS